jgi:hypothetical protein
MPEGRSTTKNTCVGVLDCDEPCTGHLPPARHLITTTVTVAGLPTIRSPASRE